MIPHEHYRGCGCANMDVYAVTRTDAEFKGEIADLYVDSIQRAEFGTAHITTKDEPGIDVFLGEERLIAALMADAIFERGKTLREAIEEAIETYGWNPSRIEDAMDRLRPELEAIFGDIEDDVSDAVARTINLGAAGIATGSTLAMASSAVGRGTVFEGYNSVVNMHAGIIRAARYSTNNFFNTNIIPAIQNEIQRVMELADPLAATAFPSIRHVLDTRLKSVPYWNVVANAAASRGYHYGYVKAAGILGHTVYRFVAVVDQRTSQVCLQMNGREFHVADAVDLMDRVALAEDVSEVKAITPWLRPAQIEGMDNSALAAAGFMIPPLHGRCRSTISIT